MGINYDRVLEDRTQLRSGDAEAPRKGAGYALRTTLRFAARNIGQMLRGRWYSFGYACVNFGTPISARDWLARTADRYGGDLRKLDKDRRFEAVGALAADIMDGIGKVVPVLSVSLVSTVLLEAEEPVDELELKGRCAVLLDNLSAAGAKVYLPRGDRDYAIHVGLRMLTLRRLATVSEDGLYSGRRGASVAGESPLRQRHRPSAAHRLSGGVIGWLHAVAAHQGSVLRGLQGVRREPAAQAAARHLSRHFSRLRRQPAHLDGRGDRLLYDLLAGPGADLQRRHRRAGGRPADGAAAHPRRHRHRGRRRQPRHPAPLRRHQPVSRSWLGGGGRLGAAALFRLVGLRRARQRARSHLEAGRRLAPPPRSGGGAHARAGVGDDDGDRRAVPGGARRRPRAQRLYRRAEGLPGAGRLDRSGGLGRPAVRRRRAVLRRHLQGAARCRGALVIRALWRGDRHRPVHPGQLGDRLLFSASPTWRAPSVPPVASPR